MFFLDGFIIYHLFICLWHGITTCDDGMERYLSFGSLHYLEPPPLQRGEGRDGKVDWWRLSCAFALLALPQPLLERSARLRTPAAFLLAFTSGARGADKGKTGSGFPSAKARVMAVFVSVSGVQEAGISLAPLLGWGDECRHGCHRNTTLLFQPCHRWFSVAGG